MNNIIGKLAILFAGLIIVGVFLNLYMWLAMLLLFPLFVGTNIRGEALLTPLYWVCLVGGMVTSFFLMRPAWIATDKPFVRKSPPSAPHANPSDDAK